MTRRELLSLFVISAVASTLLPGIAVSQTKSLKDQRTAKMVPELLDHLVGDGEQRRQHVDAERPRRSQIDDKLELGREARVHPSSSAPWPLHRRRMPADGLASLHLLRQAVITG